MAEWLHYGEGIFTNLMHQPAKVVNATVEPSAMVSAVSAALTEARPLSLVAAATTNPESSSGASSEDAPLEESMELDYTDDSALTMPVQPVTTMPVIPSTLEVVVATNIATPTAPEAGSSGSNNTDNAVLEHWEDIMSNKEAAASKIDKWAR
ncbi:hypothetical protein C0989_003884 [Termitomyces sp. Mn162]|nr:hypothetical protein C0989_003884 [Termitomyces sp. Mn162]